MTMRLVSGWGTRMVRAVQAMSFLLLYTGVEGLTVKGIYALDPGYETFNLWASYEYGGFTFAAEYIYSEGG